VSIRAGLVSIFLRRTLKKQMATFVDPAEVRQSPSLPGGGIPKNIEVTEVDAAGVPAEWVSPENPTGTLFYLHGGGYVFGGPDSHRDIACRLAVATGLRVLLLDYRLAPEHPFPAALDDSVAAYHWLLESGVEPDQLAIAGDSAGGGLSVATMVRLKALGRPLPKAAVLISPWADLAATGESVQANAAADAMISPEALDRFATLYLGEHDRKDEFASPLYADLSALPPTLVLVGSHEVLRSDSDRLVDGIRGAGGRADLSVWPKMPHVFPILAGIIPEGRKAIAEMAAFLTISLTEQNR
jgi:phosphinothricin tripeptide acetyl hydrolase